MKEYTDAELAQILDKDIFHMISAAADELQLDCYVVGGYVRDIFLESQSDDIDCVVVGSGIAVAKRLKEKLGRRAHLSVFKNFGTAQVKYYPEGVKYNPENPDEIAEKMLQLENNELYYNAQKEIGLKRAELFSWKKTAEQLLSLYEAVYKELPNSNIS